MPDETPASRLWIKDPLAIVARGAERGVVVQGAVIAELVGAGQEPATPVDAVFEAGRHVVLPGLINTHHHFFQTLTRAHPGAINKPLFPWLKALYPIWARLTPEAFRCAVRLATVELLMSGCTTAADHHYLYPEGLEQAVDIEVETARAFGLRMTVTRGSMNLSRKDGGLPRQPAYHADPCAGGRSRDPCAVRRHRRQPRRADPGIPAGPARSGRRLCVARGVASSGRSDARSVHIKKAGHEGRLSKVNCANGQHTRTRCGP